MNEIMVSICCLTYNHEKFIKDALEGFVNQKTSFKYEILIHDDASTDGTVEIIKEYEKKYPDLIKPIYQKENQYSKKIPITARYQFSRAKGKYIALCEGDDYWCDNNKLQSQFDILERNSDISLCVHDTICKNYKTNLEKQIGIYTKNTILDLRQYLVDYSKIEPKTLFQTSAYFFKKEGIDSLLNTEIPKFYAECPVGDIPLVLLLGLSGKIYYLNKIMSIYRSNVEGGWTESNKGVEITKKMKMSYECFNKYSDYNYQKEINYFIKSLDFDIKLKEKKYKEIMQKDYLPYLNKQSLKTKLYILIKAYFPIILKNK